MNKGTRKSLFAILPNCETRAVEGIISSLGKRKIPLIGLSENPSCVAFHSKYLSQKIISPDPNNEEEFIEFLLNKVNPGVLLTSNDQTTLLFSKYADKLKKAGFLTNIPSKDNLIAGFDKWQCHQRALELNIPVAKTYSIVTEEDALDAANKLGYPHIIKATRLAGGNYAFVQGDYDVLPAFKKMTTLIKIKSNKAMESGLISQEWLQYELEDSWSTEAYYDTQGKARGFWPTRRWRTVIYPNGTFGSRLYAGESLEQTELRALTKKLLDGLEWRGFAHVEWVFLQDKKKFCLNEINPRLPGYSFFPCHAGFNMAYFYYADLTCQEYEVPPLRSTVYFETFRHPGDFTSTLIACARGKYSFLKLFKSYLKALLGKRPVVVDYFEISEPKRTIYNFLNISSNLFKDFFSILKRN